MSQNQLISLLVGTKAAEAQGLTGEALSRAKMFSLLVGNPVVSLLAVRAMRQEPDSEQPGTGACDDAEASAAASRDAALAATNAAGEANAASLAARDAATQANQSAQAAGKSAEEAKAIVAAKKAS